MKGIKSFFSDFNEEWTIKYWAIVALIAGVMFIALGLSTLSLCYSHIQYASTGAVVEPQPSLISGWITSLLGLAFLIGSSFGTKGPKKGKAQKKLSMGKIEAQGRR